MSKDWTYEELSDKFGKVSLQSAKKTMIIRKLKYSINLALAYLANPNKLSDDFPNEELAFQELKKVLRETEE